MMQQAAVRRRGEELDGMCSVVHSAMQDAENAKAAAASMVERCKRENAEEAEKVKVAQREIDSWFSIPVAEDADAIEVDDVMAPNCSICLVRAPRLFIYSCGHGPICAVCITPSRGPEWRRCINKTKCMFCKVPTKGFIRAYLGGVEAKGRIAEEAREEAAAVEKQGALALALRPAPPQDDLEWELD